MSNLKFKRTKAVLLPNYALVANADGSAKSHFLKVVSDVAPYQSEREGAKPDMTRCEVIDLTSGENYALFSHKGFAKNLEVNGTYEIVTMKESGKRFPLNTVYAIEVLPETSEADTSEADKATNSKK